MTVEHTAHVETLLDTARKALEAIEFARPHVEGWLSDMLEAVVDLREALDALEALRPGAIISDLECLCDTVSQLCQTAEDLAPDIAGWELDAIEDEMRAEEDEEDADDPGDAGRADAADAEA
jgi:hypothetical protein